MKSDFSTVNAEVIEFFSALAKGREYILNEDLPAFKAGRAEILANHGWNFEEYLAECYENFDPSDD